MASWKHYGLTLLKGAIHALPLVERARQDVLRAIQQDAEAHAEDVQDFLEAQLGTVGPAVKPTRDDLADMEALTHRAVSSLPEADRGKLRQFAKRVYFEQDAEARWERARELCRVLVQRATSQGSVRRHLERLANHQPEETGAELLESSRRSMDAARRLDRRYVEEAVHMDICEQDWVDEALAEQRKIWKRDRKYIRINELGGVADGSVQRAGMSGASRG